MLRNVFGFSNRALVIQGSREHLDALAATIERFAREGEADVRVCANLTISRIL